MKYLIIGNSAAGVNAADGIRANDKKGSITIISNEEFGAYGRPLISYYLSGKVRSESMYYRSEDFYKSRNIEVLLNTEAEEIDVKKKEVLTAGGKKLSYDKLLIATGSSPFIPLVKNLDLSKQENVFTFLTYKDSIKLKKQIIGKSKVVIAGAGLIGLKAAEGLFGQVSSITVIDLADRVMASVLDKTSADIIQGHIEQNDIDFKFQTSICEVHGGERNVNKVVLSNGETLDCDILIIAVGVRPNINLAKKAGIKTAKGIIVDEYMRTSVKDIYAAGDCVESVDMLSNESKILALWTNASSQGETAGFNMTGTEIKAPAAFAMNAISFFGLQLISAGVIGTSKSNEIVTDSAENKLRRLNISNDKLVGFVLINYNQRAGIYTALISDRTKLSTLEYDITSKDIGLDVYPKEERTKKIWNHKGGC
ncbi:FAD-dependent oxidoreductase [Endomicrobiia bacterium]|uniref:NAD(P)/FAD-dependent oxidoreductase n=1 Tax=Endomicrobium trichonymphae TaxID=1408204 RepID=UPI0008652A0A|nr:FAD-dependent oxidoreductase [Candidatus Endomicrobium trichonymphae]BAV58719.1 putative NADH dehydrogenase containing FAD [Candidatus Endomicrobium trichonymphae]GHT10396.1 FAD-dependent oxidoreductase [Endomicrobiia bacterium]GHT24868.1 FAD-dependent oxidoreductase [Endomicrobiia bacterium]GMO55276.1 MAG: FAD-dependent oxidoreductase [Candidatus Endomicrobium trichonymphae]